jgi:hypothetical protein
MNGNETAVIRNVLHVLVDALPDDDLLPILKMISDHVARALDGMSDAAVAGDVGARTA